MIHADKTMILKQTQKIGPNRESNPGPLAPEARIIPLDHPASGHRSSEAFVMAAVSPAVTVPIMLDLQSQGLGTRKGIPTLALAAATLDNVFCITAFSVASAILFSTGIIS
ncbi:unnamed protein product [Strongylus vulgaris]|uniref:Uncharacterized protein n=1 Tax=Strongylus vulgaris TaxID=40348 RepID=A0A3P7IZD9_STRVU|nr:unnamed protein product [Strongylus vulgaris]